jgi:hemolysin III
MNRKFTALHKIEQPLPFQTPGEETANSILHGIGAAMAIAGMVLLILRGNMRIGGSGGGTLVIISYVIYGITMLLMFLASTLYHAMTHERAKQIFRILDHGAIYLLIAGTYTPFCLVLMQGAWGWFLFAFEWTLAITGIVMYAIGFKALKKVEVLVYILMGWAIVMGWKPLTSVISQPSLILLISGGMFYTAGTLWYRKKARRGTHVIWHVFVLLGAITHWFSILLIS